MRTRVLRTKPEAGPAGPPAAGPAGPPAAMQAAVVVRSFPAYTNARARAGGDENVKWVVVQPPAPPGALRERLPPRKLGLAPAAQGAQPAPGAPPALGVPGGVRPAARWDDRTLERAAELLCLAAARWAEGP